MPQRITEMAGEKFAPYATQALGMSSEQRNLGAMVPPNQGLTGQDGGGLYSNPFFNAQGERQALLTTQNAVQNAASAIPQAAADAMGQARKQIAEMSSAESAGEQLKNTYIQNILEQSGGGNSFFKLNARADGPGEVQLNNNMAISNAQYEGSAPELGQVQEEANRYMG